MLGLKTTKGKRELCKTKQTKKLTSWAGSVLSICGWGADAGGDDSGLGGSSPICFRDANAGEDDVDEVDDDGEENGEGRIFWKHRF